MVQVDVFLSAAAGALVAWHGRAELTAPGLRRWWHSRALTRTALVGALALVPSMLTFLCAFPEWDTMYVFGGPPPPWPLVPAFALAVALALLLGFALTAWCLRRGHPRLAAALPAVLAAPSLLVLAWGWERVWHVGSADSLATAPSANLLGSPVMWALLLVGGGGVVAPVAWACLVSRRHEA